jgi:hypothetical protein
MVDLAGQSVGMHSVAWKVGPAELWPVLNHMGAGALACISLHVRLGRALARALWHGGPGLMEHWQARLDGALAGRAECWRARRSFGMHSVAWRARPDQVVYPAFVLTRLLQVSSDSRRIVPARCTTVAGSLTA